MDKLTDLIKEAKPLYKQRKRKKTMLKAVVMTVMPLMFFGGMFQIYIEGDNIYSSLSENSLQQELLEDDFGLLGESERNNQ